MARPEARREISELRVLAALAHPVRVQLLSYLLEMGPRTATQCSQAVDASPSACSYHLRHMEGFGLVERAGAAPDGRERRWQSAATGFRFGGPPSADGPAMQATRHGLAVAGVEDHARLAKRYLADAPTLPDEWQDAAVLSNYGLLVSAAELKELGEAVDHLLRPYIGVTRADAPDEAAAVHVTVQMFRRTEAP